ncbi:hypothetical protein M7775_15065 [Sporomusa sphaeroides DSM 2875]|uniref:hypothetical protein n=1 Tax=Sporomusa sphaeroides TaxID=47679 RepID=UPI00202F7E0D|nr:hypothetical protein [Sporomusa sphaeroides]MCM0759878.1 hypothetical protein [Sporomusa sphaeroides DSM 2875]
MLKIAHIHQLASSNGLPAELMNTIREAVTALDNEYGEDRDVDSGYGGYVLVIEAQEELAALQDIHVDVTTVIPEYVDVIRCQDGQAVDKRGRSFFVTHRIIYIYIYMTNIVRSFIEEIGRTNTSEEEIR